MTFLVPRTCTEIGEDGSPVESEHLDGGSIDWHKLLAGDESGVEPGCSLTLEDFRETDAYVLLGVPGAGKTTVFEAEGERDGCHCVTARNFLALGDRPEWRDTTLFIDGLDEMRAGSPDGRTPLDRIRAKIDALGRPRFRLSCREADWFGANDRTHLETISRDGKVRVLRLDPLSGDGVRELLNHHAGIGDAEAFVATARERGIDSLLANPQSLLMLADAVARGAWPKTRTQTFELACEKLVREPNAEHQIANTDDPPVDELLDAAGRLCAVQLICGLDGVARTDAGADDDFPALGRFGGNSVALRRVLPRRLFAVPMPGRHSPIHRQLAEFLAARHLSRLIVHENVSVRRVLALLTGEGGGVVTPLRGLAAWLAARCPKARREIVELDPEGAAAYGDPGVFTRDEQRGLLERLRSLDQSLAAYRFTPMATPDMGPVLREYLTDRRRDDEPGNLVEFLLRVLAHAAPLAQLRDVYFDLAADRDCPPGTRLWAALCLASGALAQPDRFGDDVRRLLHGLRQGRIGDEDGSLSGRLLQHLYPTFVGPHEVFDYLDEKRRGIRQGSHTIRAYENFWRYDLARTSRPEDAVVVVDTLANIFERSEEWKLTGEPPDLVPARAVDALVQKALRPADDHDLRRTFRWLRLVGGDDDADSDSVRAIRDWIEGRPERYKELLREGAALCLDAANVDVCMQRAKRSLQGARVPSDYGRWCLSEIDRTEGNSNLARFWFEEAWGVLVDGGGTTGLTLEQLETVATRDEHLGAVLDALRSCDIHGQFAEMQRRCSQRSNERRREREQALANRHRYFEPYKQALRENRCRAEPLSTIAEAYWGHYLDFQGENGRERLREFLGDDVLIEAAMDGLRGAIHRSDLPTPAQVLALRSGGRRHPLAFPVLVGLELIAPDEFSRLDVDRIRLAVAFLLAERPNFPEPGWLARLVESHPTLAADEIVRFATMELRRGERYLSFVYEMSDNEWLSEVARAACPRLLNAFPVRAPRHLSDVLNRLLWSGIGSLDASTMEAIVSRKLAAKSMTVTQRAHWLAAQLVVSAQPDLDIVEGFARKHENLMAGFFAFFERSFIRRLLFDRLPSPLLGRLACLLGAGRRPLSAIHSEPMRFRESDFVRILMEALGTRTDDGAVSALADVASNAGLAVWNSVIRRTQREQRVLRRNTRYRHPDIDAVRQALERRRPANAADLAALTSEVLTEISTNIRHGNTNDWRQYWNPDGGEQQGKPKDENDCRDALLSDLQLKLGPLKIDAAPEGRYAEEKRSDIRVSYRGFNVPVEIKKSNHRDLWSAIRNQLIAKYTRDPDADGYGIYLVLWFGKECCQPPESGVRPNSAAELEERLRDTLSSEEARLISIVVVDVARP